MDGANWSNLFFLVLLERRAFSPGRSSFPSFGAGFLGGEAQLAFGELNRLKGSQHVMLFVFGVLLVPRYLKLGMWRQVLLHLRGIEAGSIAQAD